MIKLVAEFIGTLWLVLEDAVMPYWQGLS